MNCSGKIALVTGGSGGLGKAFAAALLKKGAFVSLVDVDPVGRKTSADFNAAFGADRTCFVQCDVTNDTQLKDAFSTTKRAFGGKQIGCVINNAGIATNMFERMDLAVALNLTAVIRGTMLGFDEMRTSKGGSGGTILNIASMAGLVPLPFSPVYAATKAGVVNLSRSCAILEGEGVRVNALCPSFADTNMVASTRADPAMNAVVESQGRLLTPEEVAEAGMRLIEGEYANEVMYITPHTGARFKREKSQAGAPGGPDHAAGKKPSRL